MPKKRFLFICLHQEGDIHAGSQSEVDQWIKNYENRDMDLQFEVIAKVPDFKLSMDIELNQIEFYKEEERTKEFTDKIILTICKYLNSSDYKLYFQ